MKRSLPFVFAALLAFSIVAFGAEGLVAINDGRATLTVQGRLLANEVALRLRQPASTVGNSRT